MYNMAYHGQKTIIYALQLSREELRMTIEELLQADHGPKLTLLGGKKGIGNRIDLTNVIDSWDLHKWLTGHELVFSNGLLFQTAPDRIASTIYSLHAAGAAGLLVKLNRYISYIPENAIRAADECGFPLIVSDETLHFGDIVRLLNEEVNKLPQMSQRYLAFTDLLSKNADILALLRQLSKYLNRDVFYYDNFAGKKYTLNNSYKLPDWNSAAYAELLQNTFNRTVRVSGNIAGTLIVSGAKQEIAEDELAYTTTECAVSMISMVQQRSLPPQYQTDLWKEHFISELLCGSYTGSDGDIHIKGNLCGYNFFSRTFVIIFSCAEPYAMTAAKYIEQNINLYCVSSDNYLLAPIGNTTVMLWHGNDEHLAWCERVQKAFIRDTGHPLSIGIGSCSVSPYTLKTAYQQAQRAIQIGHALNVSGVYRYDSMQMDIFLAAYASSNEAQQAVTQILGKLIEYDANNPSYCLLPTLEMIVHCGFNLTNAANALFVHYNTLKYRYGKICDIIDMDLSQFENRAKIHTALCLLQLERCEADHP